MVHIVMACVMSWPFVAMSERQYRGLHDVAIRARGAAYAVMVYILVAYVVMAYVRRPM